MFSKTVGVTLLAVPLLFVMGCGGRSSDIEKVAISGTVTFDGEPVPNGEVRFYPINGTKGPVSGGPIRDGKYKAQAGGGVPVGEHLVDIRGFRPMSKGPADPEGGAVEQYLPTRYNSDSTLTVTITSDAKVQDFNLTQRPES